MLVFIVCAASFYAASLWPPFILPFVKLPLTGRQRWSVDVILFFYIIDGNLDDDDFAIVTAHINTAAIINLNRFVGCGTACAM